MHMADALISPLVGGVMLAATAGVSTFSIKKIHSDLDQKKIPLMGVMGAFVFAAQMINFTIPGTGSSGHIGGGLLLAALLGPYAGFITMTAILLIQALVFADGGLLAFGCNVFNLGFFACFLAYPLIFRPILRKDWSVARIWVASMLAAIVGLQFGAFSVVLETLFSGKTELPFAVFALLMQPIHLAIGIVEGMVTASILTFVWKARPELLERTIAGEHLGTVSIKKILIVLSAAAVFIAGILTWFASTDPDGLEWALFKASGAAELTSSGGIYQFFADLQGKTAILPDYNFNGPGLAGLAGGLLTLALVAGGGILVTRFHRRNRGKSK